MSGRLQTVLLGIAGLAAAALLGLTGYLIARDTIALPATSLPAGEELAPPAATSLAVRARPAPPPATTTGTTGDDDERVTTSEDESGSSGSDNSGQGSEDSGQGRGRGRGRGGDD